MTNTDTLFSQMPSVQGMRSQLALRTRGDKFIWSIVVLLALISVLVVYSATGSLAYKMNKGNNEVYLFKQVAFMMIGLALIYFLQDRKSTRLNSSHLRLSRMPSSA